MQFTETSQNIRGIEEMLSNPDFLRASNLQSNLNELEQSLTMVAAVLSEHSGNPQADSLLARIFDCFSRINRLR